MIGDDQSRDKLMAEIKKRHIEVGNVCIWCDQLMPCREILLATTAAQAARIDALERQARVTYGIIHEGMHGGKATDPDHQEQCQMPSCRNARAVLAGQAGVAQ